MPHGKEEQQIKRSSSMTEIHQPAQDQDVVKRSGTLDFSAPGLSLNQNEAEKNKKAAGKVTGIQTLKKKTENIPVVVPAKKRAKKGAYEEEKDKIRELHETLENEEKTAFNTGGFKISRNRYTSLSASDLKKRAEAAKKRKNNAAKIVKYDTAHAKDEQEYTRIDPKTLKQKIAAFKKLPSKPYPLDTDDKFVANLEKNYSLCKEADQMEYWLKNAAELGFLPEDVDIAAIQNKITAFREIKNYMDTQKELMQNKYYQHFAKDDISYTDGQISQLKSTTKNKELKKYLETVEKLRKLRFVRSKGMKSTEKYVQDEGARKTELLKNRQERKKVIDIMSESVMLYSGNKRFEDKDYDARFTPELFQKSLKRFNALDFKDLHFAGVKDIAEHFQENQAIFAEVHNLEHLLFVAMDRNMAPSDQELLKIRAKIETFTAAEMVVSKVEVNVLRDPETFLDDKSYKEIEDKALLDTKQLLGDIDKSKAPKVGDDLARYYKTILKDYQQDHKNRKKKIKMIYGLTHPEFIGEGEDQTLRGSAIPQKELERRTADYQKKAFRNAYIRNIEREIHSSTSYMDCIAKVHARKTGRKAIEFGRILPAYLAGKSAGEITRVIDILQTGKKEEKEELGLKITEEAFRIDFSTYDIDKPKELYQNYASKSIESMILSNLTNDAQGVDKMLSGKKYEEMIKKAEVYYNSGAGCSPFVIMNQAAKDDSMNALWLSDWTGESVDLIDTFTRALSDQVGSNPKGLNRFMIGEEEYTVTDQEILKMTQGLGRITTYKQSRVSQTDQKKQEKNIPDTLNVNLYDSLKVNGYHKEFNRKEQAKLKARIQDEKEKNLDGEKALKNEISKIQGRDFEVKDGQRALFLEHMIVLSRSTYVKKDKKDDKKNEKIDEKIGEKIEEQIDDRTKFSEQEIKDSAERYKCLVSKKGNKFTAKADKQVHVERLEELFRIVMNFDVDRFNFRSYTDIAEDTKEDPKRFEECYAMGKLAMEAVNYISDYQKYLNDKDVKCLLQQVHLDEIQARCHLYMCAENFYTESFQQMLDSDQVAGTGYTLDKLLHITDEELEENYKAANNLPQEQIKERMDQLNFWANVKTMTEVLNGFDIDRPLSVIEDHQRKLHGIVGKSRMRETQNILNKKNRVLVDGKEGAIRFECAKETAFAHKFSAPQKEKSLTVSKRESKLTNEKSRLFEKRQNMEMLENGRKRVIGAAYGAKAGIDLKKRIAIGEENLNRLSAFLTGDAASDTAVLERYKDETKRFDLIDELTREIMEMPVDLQVTTDRQFAEKAGDLEKISQKAMAYDRILRENPEYLDRLQNRGLTNDKSDLDLVMEKKDRLLAISDYYRARRVLITDPYYVRHYDEELSSVTDKQSNEDRKRIAELIRLVANCTRRLEGEDFRDRDAVNLDQVLSRAEMNNRRQAFVSGHSDIKKADPGKAHKAANDIRKYYNAAGLGSEGQNRDKDLIIKTDDQHPYPEADSEKSEASTNMYNAMREYTRNSKNYRKILTKEQEQLLDELIERLKINGASISHFTFADPKKEEIWELSTNVQRLLWPLVKQYGAGMSREEILDMVDGLLLPQKENLDMNDDTVRNYVRDRWLDSMQKLYLMEYDYLKRYESTYGTLMLEMPTGCFLQSLGAGVKDFAERSNFGQDVANLCDGATTEKTCRVDGKEIGITELLLKYGKLPQDVADNIINLGPNFYQQQQGVIDRFFTSPSLFVDNEDERGEIGYASGNLENQNYYMDHSDIKGPKLSQADKRKLWKGALEYEDEEVVSGGPVFSEFHKKKLGLYSPAELKTMKRKRAKDAGLVDTYRKYADAREETLLKLTKEKVGGGISDDVVKSLIAFHPGMLKDGKETAEESERFFDNVKKYAGIGISDEKKEAEKREALSFFFNQWDGLFNEQYQADTIDGIMDHKSKTENKSARNAEKVLVDTRLYSSEIRHRMYESICNMQKAEPGIFDYMQNADKIVLMQRHRKQLSHEILRSIMQKQDYLDLIDIGTQGKSYPEQMYVELVRGMDTLSARTLDLRTFTPSQGLKEALEYYGISWPDFLLEKKEEPKAEEKAAEPENLIKEEENAEEKKEKKQLNSIIEEDDGEGSLIDEKSDEEGDEEYYQHHYRGNKIILEKEEKKEEQKEEPVDEQKKKQMKVDEMIQQQEGLHYELDAVDYLETVTAPENGEHVEYENQGHSTYCWACVMSGLMNSYAGKKVSSLDDVKKRPIKVPKYKESGIKNKEDYDNGVRRVNNMYAGTEYGNPMIFGDYILGKLKDTAVRSAVVAREEGRLGYCKRRFLETLSKSLEKGPVGILNYGHFVLIRKLDKDILWVNDSLKQDSDNLRPYDYTVSELFATSGQQLELVWLENIKGREQEVADQFDLKYDDKTGEFSNTIDGVKEAHNREEKRVEQVKNEYTILHRNGVESMTQLYDDVVFNSIYVPKKMSQGPAPGNGAPIQQEQQAQGVKKAEKKAEEKKVDEKKAEENVEQKAEKKEEQKVDEKKAEEKEEKKEEQKEEQKVSKRAQILAEREAKTKRELEEGHRKNTPGEKFQEQLDKHMVKLNAELRDEHRFLDTILPKQLIGRDSNDIRYFIAQMNMLSYFSGYDNKETHKEDIFYPLTVDVSKADKRQKSLKARSYEHIFEQILKFDLTKYNFKTIDDIFTKRGMDAAVLAGAMYDLQPSKMREYEKLIDEEGVECALTKDQFKEVQARWDAIHSNMSWIIEAGKYSRVIRDKKINLSELLKKDPEELAKIYAQQKSEEMRQFYSWVMNMRVSGNQNYKKIGGDFTKLHKDVRKNQYKITGKDQTESVLKAIRDRRKKNEGRLTERRINRTVEPTEEAQLKKVETIFSDVGVSEETMEDIKDTTKVIYKIVGENTNSVTESAMRSLMNNAHAIDHRGLDCMMRPVHINKDGEPAEEIDRMNRELNLQEFEGLETNKLSRRVSFLERVVDDARNILFTSEELKDYDFIRKNKERAIRTQQMMHNLLNIYTRNAGYYMNYAPEETRDFLFMLVKGSDYMTFQNYHIQRALYSQGLNSAGNGASTSFPCSFAYDEKRDYEEVKKQNDRLATLTPTVAWNYVLTYDSLYYSPLSDEEMQQQLDIIAQSGDHLTMAEISTGEEKMILKAELKPGAKEFTDADRESIIVKYLDCFIGNAEQRKKKQAANQENIEKLHGYINAFKNDPKNLSKCTNEKGLEDDLKM